MNEIKASTRAQSPESPIVIVRGSWPCYRFLLLLLTFACLGCLVLGYYCGFGIGRASVFYLCCIVFSSSISVSLLYATSSVVRVVVGFYINSGSSTFCVVCSFLLEVEGLGGGLCLIVCAPVEFNIGSDCSCIRPGNWKSIYFPILTRFI